MSQPNFALPDQLRYDLATPSDLGTNVEMCVVTPYTGSGAVTVNAGNYFIINIPKSGSNAVFDPMNSYLRFKLKLTNGTGAMTVTPAGNIDSIFRRLDVYHGSNVLEQIDQYGNLSNLLLDSQVHPVDRAYQWNILKGTSGTIGTRTGASLALAAAGNTSQYYTTTLLSGVVGSLSRCYIPLFALNGYISFRLTLDSPLAAFVSAGAQQADLTATFTGITIEDIEFHASIIHCKEQVMQAITMPMYSIPTEAYNCFECTWTRATQQEQLLPFKYVSLKTLFLTMRAPGVLTSTTQHANSYASEDLYQYSFRVGSNIIPPNRVKCPLGQNNIEAFEELKKAFHAGGNTLASMGIHNFTKYNVMTCTDASGSFILGQDLEKYSGKSGQIISGLDTTSSDLFFSGTWSSTANQDATILCDFYAHLDMVLVIVDGACVAHW